MLLKKQGWLWTEEFVWHKKIVILENGLIGLEMLGKNDVIRYDSQVKSGFGKNISNWVGRPWRILQMSCTWLLKLATVTTVRHSRSHYLGGL